MMPTVPAATVTPGAGGIPGLCDVALPDGRRLRDLTMGQVRYLATTEPSVAAWYESRRSAHVAAHDPAGGQ